MHLREIEHLSLQTIIPLLSAGSFKVHWLTSATYNTPQQIAL